MHDSSNPVVRFYRLIDEARMPQRADRSAGGTLPVRAYRYCHAVTTAAGFGWWVFPPTDLEFLWDGYDICWRCTGWPDWLPLASAAQFPEFAARFNVAAPAELAGCAPPFLTALPEPGTLQIWTGLMARTMPGWSLLVRSPANLPCAGGYSMYEGIIESDRWFGPLFTNLRFTRTHQPVRLRVDYPLAQVQPLPRIAYAEDTMGRIDVVADMGGWQPDDWADYQTAIAGPNQDPDRTFGAYAVSARRRSRGDCVADATGGESAQPNVVLCSDRH
jgi:hypothetical protein